MSRTRSFSASLLILIIIASCASIPFVWGASQAQQTGERAAHQTTGASHVTIPGSQTMQLCRNESSKQGSDKFSPANRTVTLNLTVEDPNGSFMPTIRRENVAVYEDGIRQKDITVAVEHAPVTVALLLEFGGRYLELNKALGDVVPEIGRELLEVIGRGDKIAVFKYDAK